MRVQKYRLSSLSSSLFSLGAAIALSACTAGPEGSSSSVDIISSAATVSSVVISSAEASSLSSSSITISPIGSSGAVSSAQISSTSSSASFSSSSFSSSSSSSSSDSSSSDSSSVSSSSVAPPKDPIAVPAVIQSEEFYSFQDFTPDNKGTCGDGPVDMFEARTEGGTCDVGWTQPGEWLEYEITALKTGDYDIFLTLGSIESGLTAQVDLDDIPLGTITAPGLGFDQYRRQKVAKVNLSEGQHLLRVTFNHAGINMDYIEVAEPETSCTSFEPVLAVFNKKGCIGCHGAVSFNNLGGKLNLESGNVGERLLERKTAISGAACGDDVLISQSNPDDSLLLKLVHQEKYAALKAEGCNRNPMPLGAASNPANFTSGDDFACLASWAEHVAVTETPIKEPPKSGDFVPTDSGMALAKAKYILHGGAPTDAELESIGGSQAPLNKAAMIDLIKAWEQTSEYEAKVKTFLETMLQQRPLGNIRYNEQLQNIMRDNPPLDFRSLRENLDTAFMRTAWDIVDSEQDFRNVISTRDWKVTTGLLAALAWMDEPTRPVLIRELEHLTAEDFNDWRTVRLRQSNQPANFANTAAFANSLRSIPEGGEFALRFPRVGFFSSPVFLNFWVTNNDNQFRLTLNQTLIVALGKTFDPSDATAHISENGIPEEHAVKGTVCYECHRQMDPMRLVFSNFIQTNYRGKPADTSMMPSFSFYGVTENFSNTNQFATLLSNHPEMPVGWTQKVCMWANSQSCDVSDPEFTRIVNAFKNSNFNLKVLFRQFFTSPLFTGTSQTKTFDTEGDLISMSRGDHFCQALNTRVRQINAAAGTTGGAGVCTAGKLGVVPTDEYSRGETELVHASYMSLFDAKSIDRECSRVAFSLFEANDSKVFNIDAPVDENLSYMAQYLIGYPKTHHRYDEVFTGLRRIYDISSKPKNCADPLSQGDEITCGFGSNKRHSLKAAWFAACTSPELIGIGM